MIAKERNQERRGWAGDQKGRDTYGRKAQALSAARLQDVILDRLGFCSPLGGARGTMMPSTQ
jgi:hypothetical protein